MHTPRGFIIVLLAALLPVAAGCVAGADDGEEADTAGDEAAAAPQALNGLFRIRARHSGMCLDVRGAGSGEGVRLIQYPCHGGNNQLFQIDDLGNGYHRIRAFHSDKCLDVRGASTDDRAPIIQYSCHGRTNQQFRIDAAERGYRRIVARHSSKCFDIEGASSDRGAHLNQYACHGRYNQQFSFDTQ